MCYGYLNGSPNQTFTIQCFAAAIRLDASTTPATRIEISESSLTVGISPAREFRARLA